MQFQTYKLLFPNTEYIYVGSSNNIERRFAQHRHSCFKNKPVNPKLAAVWKKWGKPFLIPVASFETEEEMFAHEQILIDTYFGKKHCLNLNPVAGKPPSLKGKPRSEETKAKISAAHKGKITSEEAKAKLSAAHKGKKLSEEHRANISAAQKLSMANPIIAISPTGEVTHHISATQASKELGLERRSIDKLLISGKTAKKQAVKGWRFEKVKV